MKAVIFDLDGTLLNTVESMEAAGSKMLPAAAVCLGDHVRPRVLLRNLPLPA